MPRSSFPAAAAKRRFRLQRDGRRGRAWAQSSDEPLLSYQHFSGLRLGKPVRRKLFAFFQIFAPPVFIFSLFLRSSQLSLFLLLLLPCLSFSTSFQSASLSSPCQHGIPLTATHTSSQFVNREFYAFVRWILHTLRCAFVAYPDRGHTDDCTDAVFLPCSLRRKQC